jgi:hypothetical protein
MMVTRAASAVDTFEGGLVLQFDAEYAGSRFLSRTRAGPVLPCSC